MDDEEKAIGIPPDLCHQSSSTASSTPSLCSESTCTVVLPEDENPLTESKKFLEELEKRKEVVKILKEREENLNIASDILFKKSEEDVGEPIKKKAVFMTKLAEQKGSFDNVDIISSACHQTIVEDKGSLPNLPVSESRVSGLNRKFFTSPFVLKRFLGYNPEVFAKNLTRALDYSILVTAGNLVLIYDYNTEDQHVLSGHRNRVVSTSVDSKGNWIATSDVGPDCCVIVWDAERCLPVTIIWEFNEIGCHYVKLSPCAKLLLTVTEKKGSKSIKLISIWEWVRNGKVPKVSAEINVDEFGPLRDIDFCCEKCQFIMVTAEKRIVFLTIKVVDHKKIMEFHYPKGLTKKSRKEMGAFNHSVYVKGTHMAVTGTSTGQVVVWSDMAWNFFDDEPLRELNNKKNAFFHMKLDRYSIEQIVSIDKQIVTVNSKGMVLFYNQRLRLLYAIKELKGCSPIVNISFNIKKRSAEGSAILLEDLPICRKRRNSSTQISDKMTLWERVPEQKHCWGKPDVFNTRDFIATTDTGDIVYVNYSHEDVKFILRNQMEGVTTLEAHPEYDFLCIGTADGKVFMYNFIKNEIEKCQQLPVVEALRSDVGAVDENDIETILLRSHITYMKYSQTGNHLACGTKSGEVWLLNGSDLTPVGRILKASFPIVKIVFSWMNEYMAFHDLHSHMVLIGFKKDQHHFIGKIRPHSKPIVGMAFVTKGDVSYLYTLGEDRYFVEYIASECDRLGFIKINIYFKVELLAKGTCLFPDPSSRTTVLMFTDMGKCRYISVDTMQVYRTVQGPMLHNGGVTYLQALGLPNQSEYLLFISRNEIGLIKCPVDGNPYKWVSHVVAVEEVEDVAVAHRGKYVFCKGKNEYINMWEVNTMPLNALEALGGRGTDPYAALLRIDPYAPTLHQVQDMFFCCQITHRGQYSEKAYEPTATIGACDVPSAFRALGFFMTDYEEDLVLAELVADSNLKLSEVEVSFTKFMETFVNHRVSRVSEPAMKKLFCNLFKGIFPRKCSTSVDESGVPLQDFLYYIENYGDKFEPCQTYIYLRALIKPFTKESEEELLKKIQIAKEYPFIDNKYYDFMPEVITYEFFKSIMLGLRRDFNDEMFYKEMPMFIGS